MVNYFINLINFGWKHEPFLPCITTLVSIIIHKHSFSIGQKLCSFFHFFSLFYDTFFDLFVKPIESYCPSYYSPANRCIKIKEVLRDTLQFDISVH